MLSPRTVPGFASRRAPVSSARSRLQFHGRTRRLPRLDVAAQRSRSMPHPTLKRLVGFCILFNKGCQHGARLMLFGIPHDYGNTWVVYLLVPLIVSGILAGLWLIVQGAIGLFGPTRPEGHDRRPPRSSPYRPRASSVESGAPWATQAGSSQMRYYGRT
jgi:hypothetical protein